MGFVRLIRSGGRRCVADATCFIPDLTQVEALSEVLPDNELPSSTTNKAAECFMHDVKNLVENFEEATEYFKVL